jgi:hypothetical protein
MTAPTREELDARLERTAHLGNETKGVTSARDYQRHSATALRNPETERVPEIHRWSGEFVRRRTNLGLGQLLSSYAMRSIRWQWENHLALGMLSMLDGDPENGKSTLVADITARITTGRPWPDGRPSIQGSVIVVGSEDSIEQVLKPRMVAAGADVSKVLCITLIEDDDGARRLPSLPEDVPMLEAAIRHMQAVLIVFDPVMPYVSTRLNSNVDKDVRQALTPLAEMLDRTACSGLMLRHLTKDDKTSNSIYRGLGSIAFTALCRTGMIVAKDKENDEYVFMVHKNNLGVKPRARRYNIEGVELPGAIETSRINWGDESDHQANELLTAFGKNEKKSETAEALLIRLLSNGPMESEALIEQGHAAGISRRTIWRAKDTLGIKAHKTGFGDAGAWLWELPAKSAKPDVPLRVPNANSQDADLYSERLRVSPLSNGTLSTNSVAKGANGETWHSLPEPTPRGSATT